MDEQIITCWKCGYQDSGEYCSHCGAPLQKEQVSIRGHFKGSFERFVNVCLSFLKSLWLVLFKPGVYFDAYFNETQPIAQIRFPLTRLWRRLSSAPQVSFGPLGFLVSSITLFLTIETLSRDLSKYMPQPPEELTSLFAPMLSDFIFVEIGWIDNLINVSLRELAILIGVFIYAFGFSLWLRKQKISLAVISDYCVYSYAAALAVGSCLGVLNAIVFLCVSGIYSEWSDNLLKIFLVNALAGFFVLLLLWFMVFVRPIVIFPKLFQVSRARILVASFGSVVFLLVVTALLSAIFYYIP